MMKSRHDTYRLSADNLNRKKYKRFAFTPTMIIVVFIFTIMALWVQTLWAATTAVETKPLVITLEATSAKAMISLERRFGQIHDLLYLYPVNEKATIVELGFPGELIVAPDKTKLSNLLSDSSSKIRINAEPNTLSRLFQADADPAAKIVDKEKRLVGIVATQKAMEPFRTGAVLRLSENHDASETENVTNKAAADAEDIKAPHPADASSPTTAAHAPVQNDETHTSASQAMDHTTAADTDEKADHGDKSQTPAIENSTEQAAHGEKTASQAPSAHTNTEHQAADTEPHKKLGHGPSFDAAQPRGAALIEAIVKPLDYELNERFWGWRPNDLIRVGDNVRNFQLGVLEITRRTAMILSGRVSRTGESSAFDPQLENAMNWFMIKPNRYWFPSAESKYQDALDALNGYKERLVKKQAKFFNRADNLIPLLMAYEDLMGSCEENLVKNAEEDGTSVSFFKADDYLYYTKGVTSVLLSILTAIEHDFGDVIASRQAQGDIHHAITSCRHALKIDPTLVMDSDPSSIFANHRANQAAPVSHVRFYLSVLIKTLST